LILEAVDRFRGETPPPARATRELVDHPACSPEEYAFIREDYTRRMDGLAAWCQRIGAIPILIVPASNDGAFEPSRSVLAGPTPEPRRQAFAQEFLKARALDVTDPPGAIEAHRALVTSHPEFAEAHYRLARLLRSRGEPDEARKHFRLARDLDGLPLRTPTDFQEAIRNIARRHDCLLIDAPKILGGMSQDGILDDTLFHDAQHLNLIGQAALAQEIMMQLKQRRFLSWPEAVPAPSINLAQCLQSFGLDKARWSEISHRSEVFFERTAYVRYDPTERLAVMREYGAAAKSIAAGASLDTIKIPSLLSIFRAAQEKVGVAK
jgi:hypothetical protein